MNTLFSFSYFSLTILNISSSCSIPNIFILLKYDKNLSVYPPSPKQASIIKLFSLSKSDGINSRILFIKTGI